MKLAPSVIKADLGPAGGHVSPSKHLREAVASYTAEHGSRLILDHHIGFTGDDIAIVMTHRRGQGDKQIHKPAWDAFHTGTEAAQKGLYGAGQDLRKDYLSEDVKGMGPAVAELEFGERPNEPFPFFASGKATGDRVIERNAPEIFYGISALVRDPQRLVVESVWSRQRRASGVCRYRPAS